MKISNINTRAKYKKVYNKKNYLSLRNKNKNDKIFNDHFISLFDSGCKGIFIILLYPI